MGSSRAGSNPARSEICFVGAAESKVPHEAAFLAPSEDFGRPCAHLDEASIDLEACRPQNWATLFPPGLEPGTFRVLGERDNHYTTETR